ncbi:hypothetical protein [Aliarcobacter butzleri]|uniref:hypothetical protein n=1 Tax=Aliarcobacter butzleri TaxID=28197 RepID=UPI002B24119D|nr:hypothetical protein [Aliarcobacter butzleri]
MKVTFTKEQLEIIKEQKEKFEQEYGKKPNTLVLPCNHWTLNENGTSNTLIRCWDGMIVIVNTLDDSIRCGITTLTSNDKINIDASNQFHRDMNIIPIDKK